MKTKIQILNRIHFLQKLGEETSFLYYNLDHVTSNEGRHLKAKYNKIRGKIEALKWTVT